MKYWTNWQKITQKYNDGITNGEVIANQTKSILYTIIILSELFNLKLSSGMIKSYIINKLKLCTNGNKESILNYGSWHTNGADAQSHWPQRGL